MTADNRFLHPDRLFPASDPALTIARELYAEIASLPIISPHGHTDPAWYADDRPFEDAAQLFLIPDHYVLRMLGSRGIAYDDLGGARGRTARRSRAGARRGASSRRTITSSPARPRACGSTTR